MKLALVGTLGWFCVNRWSCAAFLAPFGDFLARAYRGVRNRKAEERKQSREPSPSMTLVSGMLQRLHTRPRGDVQLVSDLMCYLAASSHRRLQ